MRRLTTGAPGDVVHRVHDKVLGELVLSVLDVDSEAELDTVHDWVTKPRARFWGLGELSKEELRELYRHVDSLPSHHAFLLRRDGHPIALVQSYEPEYDPVGELYEVHDGDVGVHFFLGDRGAPVAGLTARVVRLIGDFVFAQPGAQRIVVEPDIDNDEAIALMTRIGFTLGPIIDLGHKRARLAFVDRPGGDAAAGEWS
ncbi:GNAT family N-acetyltransferase [Luethyella okanaganae]|uniref:Lysine N-acyltransferase MbtK n=1 Tax=Luethyella okanaganae TaxID=69372 RepID=A0ABW1VG69_9MICO